MPASANPRISPADPIHRVATRLLLLRLLLVSGARRRPRRKKGLGLTRERPDGRIETKCTATMIIVTRVLKSDPGGPMFTRNSALLRVA